MQPPTGERALRAYAASERNIASSSASMRGASRATPSGVISRHSGSALRRAAQDGGREFHGFTCAATGRARRPVFVAAAAPYRRWSQPRTKASFFGAMPRSRSRLMSGLACCPVEGYPRCYSSAHTGAARSGCRSRLTGTRDTSSDYHAPL